MCCVSVVSFFVSELACFVQLWDDNRSMAPKDPCAMRSSFCADVKHINYVMLNLIRNSHNLLVAVFFFFSHSLAMM